MPSLPLLSSRLAELAVNLPPPMRAGGDDMTRTGPGPVARGQTRAGSMTNYWILRLLRAITSRVRDVIGRRPCGAPCPTSNDGDYIAASAGCVNPWFIHSAEFGQRVAQGVAYGSSTTVALSTTCSESCSLAVAEDIVGCGGASAGNGWSSGDVPVAAVGVAFGLRAAALCTLMLAGGAVVDAAAVGAVGAAATELGVERVEHPPSAARRKAARASPGTSRTSRGWSGRHRASPDSGRAFVDLGEHPHPGSLRERGGLRAGRDHLDWSCRLPVSGTGTGVDVPRVRRRRGWDRAMARAAGTFASRNVSWASGGHEAPR